MARRKVKAYIHLEMEMFLLENMLKMSDMVKEFLSKLMERKDLKHGRMENLIISKL